MRRCLMRLGTWFRGDHLVEIRGRDSEGFRLNPGQIPFHLPEMIVQPEQTGWWEPGSVESFWQANKVLQVREKVFSPGGRRLIVHVLLETEDGLVARTEHGRPVELPSFSFQAEDSFEAALQAAAETHGLGEKGLAPTFADPQVDGEDVHVAWIGPAAGSQLPDHGVSSLARVRSSHLGPQVRKLLKMVFRQRRGSPDGRR